jgi:hypothetical protein
MIAFALRHWSTLRTRTHLELAERSVQRQVVHELEVGGLEVIVKPTQCLARKCTDREAEEEKQ